MNRQAGMTLIEVLIAVSLLSLLSVGVLIAMRIGFNTMDKTDSHLVQNRKVANARKILENEIEGFIATVALWHPTPDSAQTVPFAQWEPRAMRFVTSYSLQDAWRGRPQIAELTIIPGEHNVGVRLIVNETPYLGEPQAGLLVEGVDQLGVPHFAPVVPRADSFILADRLASCGFEYMEQRFEPPFRVWRPDWVRPQIEPLGVRINMAPLDERPGELHVSTATVVLPVNRTPGMVYSDAQ